MPLPEQPGLAEHRGLAAVLPGDGRRLLTLAGISLVLSGGFALFPAATRQLLPHAMAYLGAQP